MRERFSKPTAASQFCELAGETSSKDDEEPASEHVAWTITRRVILNLDGAITKE